MSDNRDFPTIRRLIGVIEDASSAEQIILNNRVLGDHLGGIIRIRNEGVIRNLYFGNASSEGALDALIALVEAIRSEAAHELAGQGVDVRPVSDATKISD